MSDKNYKVYERVMVSYVAESVFRQIFPSIYSNGFIKVALLEIYNNDLPKFIEKIFLEYFINDLDSTTNDMVILKDAYRQLKDVGHIGVENV